MRLAALLLLSAAVALPARAGPLLLDYEARLAVGAGDNATTVVDLLAGGPFGDGGVAHGLFDPDGEDTGEAPAKTLWLVRRADGSTPPDDAVGLRFVFDDTGNYSGVEPSPFLDPAAGSAGGAADPFRIFLAEYPPDPIRPEIIGRLDFSNVTAAGLGSITGITGVRLVERANGGDVTLDPFTITAVPAPGTLALLVAGPLIAWPRARGRSRNF